MSMRTIKNYADNYHENSLVLWVILGDKIACKCRKN